MKKFARISCTIMVAVFISGCASKRQSADTVAQVSQPEIGSSESRAGITPGSVEDFRTNAGDTVQFAYNAHDLDDQARSILEKQAGWLVRYPGVTLSIEGHCDERGTREYNLALGARRANAIKEHLASRGVSLGRLQTVSYGKERPTCSDSNDNCWEQNRRGMSVVAGGAVS